MTSSVDTARWKALDGALHFDFPLAPLTTFKIGGSAEIFFVPASVDACVAAAALARTEGLQVRFLGGGTNTLVSDRGVKGLVMRLASPAFTRIAFGPEEVEVGAGAGFAHLVHEGARRGCESLAGLGGIPGMVGGAIAMNAGGRYGEIGAVVKSLRVLANDGMLADLPARKIRFGYRSTDLAGGLVLSAVLAPARGSVEAAQDRLAGIMAYKKETQPLGDASAGCMFRNPGAGKPAASRLIDEAGLKGGRVGGIVVSDRHANFFVNEGGGTAADVRRLIDTVRVDVRRRTGITLELEVQMWGFDDA